MPRKHLGERSGIPPAINISVQQTTRRGVDWHEAIDVLLDPTPPTSAARREVSTPPYTPSSPTPPSPTFPTPPSPLLYTSTFSPSKPLEVPGALTDQRAYVDLTSEENEDEDIEDIEDTVTVIHHPQHDDPSDEETEERDDSDDEIVQQSAYVDAAERSRRAIISSAATMLSSAAQTLAAAAEMMKAAARMPCECGETRNSSRRAAAKRTRSMIDDDDDEHPPVEKAEEGQARKKQRTRK